jgi:DNA ligase-1
VKREYLLLAQTYNALKHGACPSWFLSEKLDGVRAWWDGGISRGIPCRNIGYANTAKHDRYQNEQVATGLWTRYGQAIQAPAWFLNMLPKIPLDGELTAGRKGFQTTTSTVKKLIPIDSEWQNISYVVFDSPPLAAVFAPGTINTGHFKKTFKSEMLKDISDIITVESLPLETPFYSSYAFLKKHLKHDGQIRYHEQRILSSSVPLARGQIQQELEYIEKVGGEGLMLRNPISHWKPERSFDLLKVKSLNDAEATVIGYRWAKPTDLDRSISGLRTDKLLGLMGSLLLKMENGIEFELGSGFTEQEREMSLTDGRVSDTVKAEGISNPGEIVSNWIHNPNFPLGSKVTYKYRELSNDGIPKEGRYSRKKENL